MRDRRNRAAIGAFAVRVAGGANAKPLALEDTAMAGVPFDKMTGKIWFNGAFVDSPVNDHLGFRSHSNSVGSMRWYVTVR